MPTSADGSGTEAETLTRNGGSGIDVGEGRRDHLVVEGLTAGYGRVPVIRDVSMSVARGRVATVVGPNGAGKSTLLKALTGAIVPMAGTITLGGEGLAGLSADRIARHGVGYVPQLRDVFNPLSVRENLEMGGFQLPRRDLAQRIDEVVAGFPALSRMLTRAAGDLSGGERKMLAIARVLMTRPSLVILDEPTAGLAPKLAENFLRDSVSRLAADGVAVLLVEQRARDALAISDFAYVMVAGQVRLAEPAAQILSRPDLGDIFLGHIRE